MTSGDRFDLARAEEDPAAAFPTPQDVLQHEELSREEKRRILERWKLDALDMEVASEENMGGGENSLLAEVALALDQLGEDDGGNDGTQATKHGF